MKAILRVIPWLLVLLLPGTAFAEIYVCDGVYKNIPCDAEPEPDDIAAPGSEEDAEKAAAKQSAARSSKLAAKKMSSLNGLRQKAFEAKQNHGIDVDIRSAEAVCQSKDSTIEECQGIVSRQTQQLSTTIHKKEMAAKLEESNQLKREAIEVKTDKMDVEVNIDGDAWSPHRRPRKPRRPRKH